MNERNFWLILAHYPKVMGHELQQDVDDVPGGCSVCWANVGGVDE